MAQKINVGLLKKELSIKNISLRTLSRDTGISLPHLSMMFNGKRNMSIAKLNVILNVAGIDIDNITEK